MFKNLVIGLAAALACGCGTDIFQDNGGGVDGGGGGGGSSTGDLPCDVQAVLTDHCTSCHGNPTSGNAPMPIVTRQDLMAGTMGTTVAARALIRMTATTNPMPPAPAALVTPAEIATFQAWINAGMPAGSCGAVSDPVSAPPTCTSGTYWTHGNSESPLMHPGVACIGCHATSGEAPHFTVAGTLYPTGHEPNDCNGSGPTAKVVITDAHNTVFTLTANSAGNFYSNAAIVFPIQAKVVMNGQERVMAGAQTSGDCNTCHTQTGTSMAPGRVVLP